MLRFPNFFSFFENVRIFRWLIDRPCYKCGNCNYPLLKSDKICPYCEIDINWEGLDDVGVKDKSK